MERKDKWFSERQVFSAFINVGRHSKSWAFSTFHKLRPDLQSFAEHSEIFSSLINKTFVSCPIFRGGRDILSLTFYIKVKNIISGKDFSLV